MSARYRSEAAVEQVLTAAAGKVSAAQPPPDDVLDWLARLRLLEGVPFTYLVTDERLLPLESARFFFLDRNWTDAAVDGALSAGASTTRDRAHLVARHQRIRDAVDATERNVWIKAAEPGLSYDAEPVGTVTGFLLRSRAVSGWPGLRAQAFHDGQPLRPLRIERLAPAVLLALFDGPATRVLIEEPHQGLQFGVEAPDGGGFTVARRPPLPVGTTTVLFRSTGAGVVDVRRLHTDLGHTDSDGSAGLALQLVQNPFQQEFSGTEGGPLFSPSISLEDLAEVFEEPSDDAIDPS
ncbi:hypothetical protein AB0B50_03410 [Streptomyces sp. NPDC041068]|uniref:hypothetical protein n=1 Tax=Streptomyces sp. NPDC041068 TaxID=3155130 RepID=UPI003411B0C6